MPLDAAFRPRRQTLLIVMAPLRGQSTGQSSLSRMVLNEFREYDIAHDALGSVA
jgi:hypothetical protein